MQCPSKLLHRTSRVQNLGPSVNSGGPFKKEIKMGFSIDAKYVFIDLTKPGFVGETFKNLEDLAFQLFINLDAATKNKLISAWDEHNLVEEKEL